MSGVEHDFSFEATRVFPVHESQPLQEPPSPVLFEVLSAGRPCAGARAISLRGVERVELGRSAEAAVSDDADGPLRVGVCDPWMSTRHALLTRDNGRWVLADLGSSNGTFVNGVRTSLRVLHDDDLVEIGDTFYRLHQNERVRAHASRVQQLLPSPGVRLCTLLPGLRRDLDALMHIARSDASVLLHGPSGSGKEVLARSVHDVSRRQGSYVAINCAALPRELVESELFGCAKGAFSGAGHDRPGLIMASDGGTLVLDEIGDLPLPAQAVLLRVLEENRVRPLGSVRSLPVNLRVVAATHRDLQRMIRDQTFREDLLARLQGYSMELPSLAQRREDLGHLSADLLVRWLGARAEQIVIERRAARALLLYPWPLNARELARCLRRAVMLADGDTVQLRHLPQELQRFVRGAAEARAWSEQEQARRRQLVHALRQNGGNVSAAARSIHSFRSQVQRWIRRYEIEAEEYMADGRAHEDAGAQPEPKRSA